MLSPNILEGSTLDRRLPSMYGLSSIQKYTTPTHFRTSLYYTTD